jgi:hypothetical protein
MKVVDGLDSKMCGNGITPVSGYPQVEPVKNILFVEISIYRFSQTSGGAEVTQGFVQAPFQWRSTSLVGKRVCLEID